MPSGASITSYPCSLEQVGGVLESLLQAQGWTIDFIERVQGQIHAGRRGWWGYRTLKVSLRPEGGQTHVEFELRCRPKEFERLCEALDQRLADIP